MITIERALVVEADESTVRQRLLAHMQKTGYRPGNEPDTFTRGSKFGSLFAWKPGDLYASIVAHVRRTPDWTTAVDLAYRVQTTGQLITPADRGYWNAEADALVAGLTGVEQAGADLTQVSAAIGKMSTTSALIVLVGMLLGLILGGALGQSISSGIAGLLIGGLLGGLLGQIYRRGQLKKPGAVHAMQTAVPQAPAAIEEVFKRDLRSWGLWLIVTGVISLATSGLLSGSWGVMLILLGAGSFVFRTPALYIVYGTTLLWAAVSNGLLSGDGMWGAFAVLQVFLAFRIFFQFRRFNRAYQAGANVALQRLDALSQPADRVSEVETLPPDRYASFFPWVSLALGVFGLFSLLASFVGQVIYMDSNLPILDTLYFIFDVAFNLCLMSFACGLGALLVRHRFKGASIAGMIFGGLGTLAVIVLLVLG